MSKASELDKKYKASYLLPDPGGEVVRELIDELRRIDSWSGLIELLDRHWPEDIFPTLDDDDDRDSGPRIVSLIRWVQRLREDKNQQQTRIGKLEAACQKADDGISDALLGADSEYARLSINYASDISKHLRKVLVKEPKDAI